MTRATRIFVALIFVVIAPGAAAQTYGLATLPPGALMHALSSVVGKVVQDHSKLQMRVQGFGGDSSVLDAVANRSSDFFALDVTESADAYNGRGNWSGKKRPTLRTAITLYGFQVAPFVRKDSPIKSIADLKGKRVPGSWAQQTGVMQLSMAMLAAGGLTYDDVVSAPVVNVVRAADDFKAGKLDMFFFAVGAPKVAEVAASVDGVRLLPYENTPRVLKAMQAVRPEYYLTEVHPAPHIVGLDRPAHVQTFDFIIGAGAHVPDEAVYQLVRALHANKKDLVAGHPSFNRFDPAQAGKPQPTLPHHPGAIKFFKEAGIWRG
jgi:TRAP transporter TAXI family solute receptor